MADSPDSEAPDRKSGGKVSLNPPWSSLASSFAGPQQVQLSHRGEDLARFVEERSRVHALWIVEREKTKRLSLIGSVILVLGASIIFVFAPEGRETISSWLGAALLAAAAGAAGYGRLWFKSPPASLTLDSTPHDD